MGEGAGCVLGRTSRHVTSPVEHPTLTKLDYASFSFLGCAAPCAAVVAIHRVDDFVQLLWRSSLLIRIFFIYSQADDATVSLPRHDVIVPSAIDKK
mmetsp:Transcript_5611/g.13946  ORF Transcript_5611/g.13946 Transcript_5611/m.13946 type:complete len:96 (-) Transcript_5611:251-538(-)